MVDLDEMAEEQDRMLRELAELGMEFAHELKGKVALVTSVPEADALALAFYRVSRGVRLSLALRSKLARERLETGKLQRTAALRATDRRKAQITAVLDREIFADPHTQEEADQLSERLVERLDHDALFDHFLHGPVDRAIAKVRKDIGLPEIPDPPPGRSPIGGEADRGDSREPEGVEAHSDRHGLQPPHRPAAGAPLRRSP